MLDANFVLGMKNLQKATSLLEKGNILSQIIFFKGICKKIINYLFLKI
jgi:hypothetical protein